jgi:hypothetical protein
MRPDLRDRQQGQAMTEFLVACLVLIPLFLAIPLLGKYMDIRHSAIQGSRYLAWERTVWTPERKDNTALENELRQRVFTSPGTALHAQDGKALPDHYNPLWKDIGGRPMLANYSDVEGRTETGRGETSPGLIYNSVVQTLVDGFGKVMGILETLGGVRPAQFEINVKGMYSGQIGVTVAEQGQPMSTQAGWDITPLHVPALTMTLQPDVIITDAWGVSGPGEGHHCTNGQAATTELCQVAPLVLGNVLSGWFNKVVSVAGLLVPEFKKLDFGHIEPDLPPDDRHE